MFLILYAALTLRLGLTAARTFREIGYTGKGVIAEWVLLGCIVRIVYIVLVDLVSIAPQSLAYTLRAINEVASPSTPTDNHVLTAFNLKHRFDVLIEILTCVLCAFFCGFEQAWFASFAYLVLFCESARRANQASLRPRARLRLTHARSDPHRG